MTAGTADQSAPLGAITGALQELPAKLSPSRWARPILISLLSGWVLLPLLAYLAGQRLIGPYEGPSGLGGFLGSLYADAGRGGLLALTLLFTPVLLIAIWKLRAVISISLPAAGTSRPR